MEGVEANNDTAVDTVNRVEGVKANNGAAVDTVGRVKGVEYAPMALSGVTEATCPVDPLPFPPAQRPEGFGMTSCCIVSRHWFVG